MIKNLYYIEFSRGSSYPDFSIIIEDSLEGAIKLANQKAAVFCDCYVISASEVDMNTKGVIATATQCC